MAWGGGNTMITRFDGTTKVADVTPAPLTIDDIYPIGIIVCGAKPTVGTWEKVEGRFLLGSSSSHAVGSAGGEETHILKISEMPSHIHYPSAAAPGSNLWLPNNTNYERKQLALGNSGYYTPAISGVDGYTWTHTDSSGGDQAHNNMPPYLSVDMWRRTA